jgi:hypothetical protein
MNATIAGLGEYGQLLLSMGLAVLVGVIAGLYCRHSRRSQSGDDDAGSLDG